MNELEQHLIDDLRRVAADIDVPTPRVQHLTNAGQRRLHRQRTTVMLTGAAAILVLIAGFGSGPRLPTSTPEPAQHGDSGRPACTPKQLRVTSNSGGGAMGTFYVPIRVRNVGAACLLDPRQTVLTLVPPSGVSATRLDLGDQNQHGRVPLLPTGNTLLLQAAFPGQCAYARNSPPGTVGVRLLIDGQGWPLSPALRVLPRQSCRPALFVQGPHHAWAHLGPLRPRRS